MPPLSTLTPREGQADLRQSSSESARRARSTTRIASTPAAMAAASGSRDGSGPINGTGAGPATGLGALATVDFACAAASFAADVRSPLVSASFGAAGSLRSAAPSSPRPSWRPSSPVPSWRRWWAFLAGAFFASLGRRSSWQAVRAVRWQAGPDPGSAPTTPAQLPVLRRQASRRVDPAGLPSGCSFAPASSTRQWLPSCQVGYGANRSRPARPPASARRP